MRPKSYPRSLPCSKDNVSATVFFPGVPWGPYGFHSGVTQEDVSKDEAEALGIALDKSAEVAPLAKFNDNLWASVRNMDPAIKAALIKELQAAPKPRSPQEAARAAVAKVRAAQLSQGLEDAIARGQPGKAEKYRKAIAELDAKLSPAQGLAVREEAGKIVLNEEIHERLAKVMDGGGSLVKRQEAIAQKIFEMVDRKGAEPRNRADGGKGIARADLLLRKDLVPTPEERKILKSPLEILLVHTPEGRLKKVVLGKTGTVSIPADLEDGAILSHNHPGGNGPSGMDLNYVLTHPTQTLRIVTKNGRNLDLYRLRARRPLNKKEIESIVADYTDTAVNAGDHRQARLEALSLILQQHGEMFSAELETMR